MKNNKQQKQEKSNTSKQEINQEERRSVLKGAAMLGICASASPCLLQQASAEEAVDPSDPAHQLPQVGDCLVYADGDKEGEVLDLSDLEENKNYINCWPRETESGVVRNGSRYNKLLAIRLNPDELDKKTQAYAKDGILVFSAICTHQGCDISAWIEEKQQFFCYCHYSRFDPKKFGKVAYGPARKKLPLIPIKIEEGVVKVDGEFTRKPG